MVAGEGRLKPSSHFVMVFLSHSFGERSRLTPIRPGMFPASNFYKFQNVWHSQRGTVDPESSLAFHSCPCWWICLFSCHCKYDTSFMLPSNYHMSRMQIFPHRVAEICKARDKGPSTDHPRSSESAGDGEHRLMRDRGMKTECRKKRSTGGKCDGVEDIFSSESNCAYFHLCS